MLGREEMLREIEREVEYTRRMTGREVLAKPVMTAMKTVPRHEFVLSNLVSKAYYNGPLPIGYGQTISQPYIVALMTDLLEPEADDRILEIGTGSGYQAAVLSRVVKQVYTQEIIAPLAAQAMERFQRLEYLNIACRVGDGYDGWQEESPFDGIIVTAASPNIPPPLVEQLKPSGRLVIPVGQPFFHQELMLVEKDAAEKVAVTDVLGVSFVPLTRQRVSETP